MKLYQDPPRHQWASLVQRPAGNDIALQGKVREILDVVRKDRDAALFNFTEQFDGIRLDTLNVSTDEIKSAAARLPPELKNAIGIAKQNITCFHEAQRRDEQNVETMPGVRCWRKSVPIERVGIYIPGGSAPLFSTVLMLAIPARLAGCKEIILCSPPSANGEIGDAILYAADLCGVTMIYITGGAQAIAAMAYGTQTIPACYKIFGPGNRYVTLAKQIVSMDGIAIDMPAGPSELLVLADETAKPSFIAADFLAQAEHGADSQVMLVTMNMSTASLVEEALNRQLSELPRKNIASVALNESRSVVFSSMDDAIDFVNSYAPEHLTINTQSPEIFMDRIVNAGSVFLGIYTPEAVGDYASGTNHTLPTNGYARAWSGVSLDSFQRQMTFQQLTKEGLELIGPVVEIMAEAEQLEGHKRSVSIRRQK